MKHLITYIRQLTNVERNRADKEHGPFHSDHEGLAVLWEEIWEANDEMKRIADGMEELKNAVFIDSLDGAHNAALDIKKHATLMAAEAIQVAAVAQRFIDSQVAREALEGRG